MGDRVLVVDDEPLVRDVLTTQLTTQEYEVVQATNGEESIELASSTQPHVILMDMGLPGLDGIEACRRLKANKKTRHIPVIMMTGFVYEKEVAIEAGADDFVSKPIDFTELAFRLKSIRRVRHLTDEFDRTAAYVEELQKDRSES
jgi:DNA-binding response OmpR family regulator